MARKYALVNNNIVTDIVSIEESEYSSILQKSELLIDIEDASPVPEKNWILQGNKLVDPANQLPNLQAQLAFKIKKAREFGELLRGEVTDKIGAINILSGKTEAQIVTVATTLLPIGDLLSGGALKTARSAMQSAKAAFPEYTAEFDYAINKITDFVGN